MYHLPKYIMEVIKIESSDKEFNIKQGEQLSYSFQEHISVGYTGDFEIEDLDVLTHIQTDTRYAYPEKMQDPQITGADAATTTFVFEGQKTGTTLLIIKKYYRSRLEEELRFRVNVI